jgi:CO/xanthine dehydrogenase FAD-binding subunit
MALPQFQAPPPFEDYINAADLAAAVAALADGRGVPVAGGTDLWVQKEQPGAVTGDRLVNIRNLPELKGIGDAGGRIRIGALATMTDILGDPLLREAAPILPLSADRFASVQIRNAATLGGNVANASPAGDMAPALLCLDAAVELARQDGNGVATREVALADFFTGPGQSARAPQELVTAILAPVPPAGAYAGFCKTGPRPALEIARVSMAILGEAADGALRNPRIAFGAVAPTPIRATRTEALIDGQALDDDLIARALDTMDGEISPIADHRASEWYRRHLARTYLEQELRHVRDG